MKLRLTTGYHTVDGRNPANQLRLIVYPTIFTRFYTSKRWFSRRISEPSTCTNWQSHLESNFPTRRVNAIRKTDSLRFNEMCAIAFRTQKKPKEVTHVLTFFFGDVVTQIYSLGQCFWGKILMCFLWITKVLIVKRWWHLIKVKRSFLITVVFGYEPLSTIFSGLPLNLWRTRKVTVAPYGSWSVRWGRTDGEGGG